MSRYAYQNYIGPDGFLFFSCDKNGDRSASLIAGGLVGKEVRIYYECLDCEPSEVSLKIKEANATVFFITQSAVESLRFRNEINYAINEKKDIICFMSEGCTLSHGLDMQLANYPVYDYKGSEDAEEKLIEHGIISQDVIGGAASEKNVNRTKQIIFTAIVAAAFAALIWGTAAIIKDRVDYYTSDSYRISMYGNSVDELDLSNAGLKDISALRGMRVRSIDLSGDPDITDFSPLTEVEGLESVTISQSVLPYIYRYRNNGFEIIVEK